MGMDAKLEYSNSLPSVVRIGQVSRTFGFLCGLRQVPRQTDEIRQKA